MTSGEKEEVVAICDHLRHLRFSTVNPYAFTEHGTIMLAAILYPPVAVEASVAVVRAFVKFREILVQDKNLARKLGEMEAKYDHQFKVVFDAVGKLIQLPRKDIKRPRTGYRRSNEKD